MRYYMETQNETNGLKRWLQARTTGLCMTWSRLLHFLVVRSGPVLLSNCCALRTQCTTPGARAA